MPPTTVGPAAHALTRILRLPKWRHCEWPQALCTAAARRGPGRSRHVLQLYDFKTTPYVAMDPTQLATRTSKRRERRHAHGLVA
eukprot:1210475-Prymnesium_polylepis.1